MAHDYYLGRIGGSRLWVWSTAPTPPNPDTGISGFTRRRTWRLILGEPAGARAFVWNDHTFRATRVLPSVASGGGPRIFRRRGMPVV